MRSPKTWLPLLESKVISPYLSFRQRASLDTKASFEHKEAASEAAHSWSAVSARLGAEQQGSRKGVNGAGQRPLR